MKKESEEELQHAYFIEEYLLKRNAVIELGNELKIETKKDEWKKPLDLIGHAFVLEVQNSNYLSELLSLAKQSDELTAIEIAKLYMKQIESVNELEVILKKARQYSALEGLYYHLDHELGKKGK